MIELLEAGEAVFDISVGGLGGGDGKKLAKTHVDLIQYQMEHGPFNPIRLREFMQGLVDGGPTKRVGGGVGGGGCVWGWGRGREKGGGGPGGGGWGWLGSGVSGAWGIEWGGWVGGEEGGRRCRWGGGGSGWL